MKKEEQSPNKEGVVNPKDQTLIDPDGLFENVSKVQLEAERLVKSGLSVIPIRADGSKAPAITWKVFQARIATPEELHRWFRKGNGLAAVAGKVSGNLEILDFDDPNLFDQWESLVEEFSGVSRQRKWDR